MRPITVVLAFALLAPISMAHADSLGAAGRIIELEVNNSNADTYLQYHGRVVITAVDRESEYRWGGTACSNRTLTESQVTMLQRAIESGMAITPRYLPGQGSNKCLVGYVLRAP
ncbi:MAG: hypothetical protein JNK64_27060 [Myxococcales bacterium]|nr:hypothetical protein [Myxococcales bacterium]